MVLAFITVLNITRFALYAPVAHPRTDCGQRCLTSNQESNALTVGVRPLGDPLWPAVGYAVPYTSGTVHHSPSDKDESSSTLTHLISATLRLCTEQTPAAHEATFLARPVESNLWSASHGAMPLRRVPAVTCNTSCYTTSNEQ
jgi:hypothetical protein